MPVKNPFPFLRLQGRRNATGKNRYPWNELLLHFWEISGRWHWSYNGKNIFTRQHLLFQWIQPHFCSRMLLCICLYLFCQWNNYLPPALSLHTHILLLGMLHGCTIKLPQPVPSFVQTTTYCKKELLVCFQNEIVGMTFTTYYFTMRGMSSNNASSIQEKEDMLSNWI